eukprot:jgi/Mesen1/5727/ME000029S05036
MSSETLALTKPARTVSFILSPCNLDSCGTTAEESLRKTTELRRVRSCYVRLATVDLDEGPRTKLRRISSDGIPLDSDPAMGYLGSPSGWAKKEQYSANIGAVDSFDPSHRRASRKRSRVVKGFGRRRDLEDSTISSVTTVQNSLKHTEANLPSKSLQGEEMDGGQSAFVEGGSSVSTPTSGRDHSMKSNSCDPSVTGISAEPALVEGDDVSSKLAEGVPRTGSSGRLASGGGQNGCPPHGLLSICGRRREMEDTVTVLPAFTVIPPDSLFSQQPGTEVPTSSGGREETPLHFFAVYDGHGGSKVAAHCAEQMQHALAKKVKSVGEQQAALQNRSADVAAAPSSELWQQAFSEAFHEIDAEVSGSCSQAGCRNEQASCQHDAAPDMVGTTAVVSVVTPSEIVVGNCGDSRAVMSRAGKAIPLSSDHKPNREDEQRRVEAAGGRVVFWNGYRVLGVLAMSRAIGDRYLKPYVIAEPEVTCTLRSAEDEFIILASDGLWDVVNNDVACDVVRQCLARKSDDESKRTGPSLCDSPASVAAALLAKLAFARGSADNISVVIIDLRSNRPL